MIIIILVVAFLGTIIFEWGMNYLGLRGSSPIIFAKVNGREITPQEYEAVVNRQLENMKEQNKGKEIDEQSIQQVREQVWNSLVSKILLEQEADKMGIKVTEQEVSDWVTKSPETLPEWLKKFFIDSTGFRADIFEQALNDKRPEIKKFWVEVEEALRETLLQSKMQSVIVSSIIIPDGEVLQKYKDENINFNFDYILLDVNTITDTIYNVVTENELKDYFDKHKDDFRQEEAVKFKYVTFSDSPTLEDSIFTKKELEAYLKDLRNLKIEDSTLIDFVNRNSMAPFSDAFQKPSALGKEALKFLFTAKQNDVSQLIIDQDAYKIIRLLDTQEGEETFMNAVHILVNFGTDTAAAKKKAEDLLKRAKKGEDFSELAFQNSDDPSAKQNKGDLGWFGKGAMVKEFEEACLGGKPGEILGPVKTQFGFHIIKIIEKSKKEFKVAEIKKSVKAGSGTKGIVKSKAEEFYKRVDKGEIFDSVAKSMNISAMSTPEVVKNGFIPGAGSNKSLLNFAFEHKVNALNKPIKVQGGIAVYQTIEKIPEGYKNFDSVKIVSVKPKVVNDKKMEKLMQIAGDMKNKIQNQDLNSLKNEFPLYSVLAVDSMTVSKPFASLGQDYALTNVLIDMKPGEISAPIKSSRGVYLVKMKNITPYNQQDFLSKSSDLKKQMFSTRQQSAFNEWLQSLQTKADIVDNRDMFYN
jgi:parvulin-like peptidyl-prolyl isomerase